LYLLVITFLFYFCSDISELRKKQQILFEKKNISHSYNQETLSVDLRIYDSSLNISQLVSYHTEKSLSSNISYVPTSKKFFNILQQNKSSLFVNFILFKSASSESLFDTRRNQGIYKEINKQMINNGEVLFGNVKMIKYDFIPKFFHFRYLLSDLGLVELSEVEKKRMNMSLNTIISFWKPEVSVKFVSEFTRYPVNHGKLSDCFHSSFFISSSLIGFLGFV
jgi:hypothetical protein